MEKSIRNGAWENEEDHLFVSAGEKEEEEEGGFAVPERLRSCSFSFFSSSWGCLCVSKLSFMRPLLDLSSEEETLARFLAALDIDVDPSTQDEDGMDSFDRYLVENDVSLPHHSPSLLPFRGR